MLPNGFNDIFSIPYQDVRYRGTDSQIGGDMADYIGGSEPWQSLVTFVNIFVKLLKRRNITYLLLQLDRIKSEV